MLQVSYSQHKRFCNVRNFMAVLYAENLTSFKSSGNIHKVSDNTSSHN